MSCEIPILFFFKLQVCKSLFEVNEIKKKSPNSLWDISALSFSLWKIAGMQSLLQSLWEEWPFTWHGLGVPAKEKKEHVSREQILFTTFTHQHFNMWICDGSLSHASKVWDRAFLFAKEALRPHMANVMTYYAAWLYQLITSPLNEGHCYYSSAPLPLSLLTAACFSSVTGPPWDRYCQAAPS